MTDLQASDPKDQVIAHLVPQSGLAAPGPTVSELLNEAPTSKFHRRAVLISGMGFFTDAYDLFVIATVAALVKTQWHLSTTQTSWVDRLGHPCAHSSGRCLRAHRGRSRSQDGVRHRRRDHDRRRHHLSPRPGVHLPRRRTIRPRSRDRRRLPRLGRPHERVREPQRPWAPGRARVLDAGPRAHRRPARRSRAPLLGHQRQPHVAPAARLRRHAGRRGRLPPVEDARVTAVPGQGQGQVRDCSPPTPGFLRKVPSMSPEPPRRTRGAWASASSSATGAC